MNGHTAEEAQRKDGATLGDAPLWAALATSSLGMALLDGELRFTALNHALLDLLQAEPSRFLGQPWLTLADTPDFQQMLVALEQMREGVRDNFTMECAVVQSRGQRIWLTVTASAIRRDGLTFDAALVQVADVTEARVTRERYRLLAENGSDVVVSGSNDGRLEWVSPSVEELLGWRSGEMVGTFFLDYIHPDERQLVTRQQGRLLSAERVAFEARFKTQDGSYKWLNIVAKPLLDETGRVIGRTGGLRDASVEVAQREQLRANKARYRVLAETASDVVYTAGPDRIVTYVSPNVVAVLGWTPEELVGRSMAELLHPDDLVATTEIRHHAYNGNPEPTPATGVVNRVRTKQGDYR